MVFGGMTTLQVAGCRLFFESGDHLDLCEADGVLACFVCFVLLQFRVVAVLSFSSKPDWEIFITRLIVPSISYSITTACCCRRLQPFFVAKELQ